MARDGYRRRTVDPALLAAPAVLFTLGRINCRQLSAHKPEGSCGRGSLYSACYPRCWVRAVSGGACHGLRWPFRLSSSRHAPGRAGDRLRRAPNRYDTETKVRSTRWTMSGSSASAIAITTRIPGNGIFRRRKTCGILGLLDCVWRGSASRLGVPSIATNLRQAAQDFRIEAHS